MTRPVPALSLVTLLAAWPAPVHAQLDPSWTVTANGQTVTVNADGTFLIPNVPSPDQFGPGGVGSAPDFISDDAVRVIGTRTVDGVTYYAVSECFTFEQGATVKVPVLDISTTPPLSIDTIAVAPAEPFLTAVDQTTVLVVTSLLTDGTETDIVPADFCNVTFRTSNPAIATIDQGGLITAVGPGTALLTATIEGATATSRVTVSFAEPTTVEGFVVLGDGTPASGASVQLVGLVGTAVTDGAGYFSIAGVATDQGPILATASIDDGGTVLNGLSMGIDGVSGGITDVGIITPSDDIALWDGGGDATSWSDAANWSGDTLPDAGDTVIIDVPGADPQINGPNVTTSIAALFCEESLYVTPVPFANSVVVNGPAEIKGQVTVPGALVLNGQSVIDGQLLMNGGVLAGSGHVTLNGGGTYHGVMRGTGTTVLPIGQTMSAASVVPFLLEESRRFENYGTFENNTGLNLNNSTVFSNKPGALLLADPQTSNPVSIAGTGLLENLGTLRVDDGAVVELGWFVGLDSPGLIDIAQGVMWFNSLDNSIAGTLRIAAGQRASLPKGCCSYTLTLLPTSTTQIEIASGQSFGQLDFDYLTSGVVVNGHLELQVQPEYAPVLGESFDIAIGVITGQFDSVSGLDLGDGLQFEVSYVTDETPNAVRLTVVAAP